MTGAATDTFAISEDGVTITTVTLASTAEKWTTTHPTIGDFKVNWTPVAGTPAATLNCWDDR